MLEETGFIAREDGEEFLILTCPRCRQEIIFTQLADPAVICAVAASHTYRCTAQGRVDRPRVAQVAVAGK